VGKCVVQIEVFDVYVDRPCSWGGDDGVQKLLVGSLLDLRPENQSGCSIVHLTLYGYGSTCYNSHIGRFCVGGVAEKGAGVCW
jgi:hypothetical protein